MPMETRFRPDLIHPTAFVAQGAVVVGDVTIGAETSVWFNAVVRGDTTPITIGARCNIQDGVIMHADPGFPCVLSDGVTVGHAAIVHGASIGANVVIGMRAIIMNGAEIGEDSIVGAGAVVTAGSRVPPGSLVLGTPGKVRRSLTEAERGGNRTTADHYVGAAQEYRRNGDTPAV